MARQKNPKSGQRKSSNKRQTNSARQTGSKPQSKTRQTSSTKKSSTKKSSARQTSAKKGRTRQSGTQKSSTRQTKNKKQSPGKIQGSPRQSVTKSLGFERDTVTLLDDNINFLSPQLPYKERVAIGKALRDQCPRANHSTWKPDSNRRDPLKLLASQDVTRVARFLPLRYGRMMESPFAFYRGAALIMASDLATVPHTNLIAQLCGDCHLSNFGVFSTPERNEIFDLNDFDETLPGPFEWDLKRLAASFVVAAYNNKFSKSVGERCVEALARTYREKMEEFSQMPSLELWYSRIEFEDLARLVKKTGRKSNVLENLVKTKEKKDHAGAVAKLTELKDGKRRIKDEVPLIFHIPERAPVQDIHTAYHDYTKTLWESRRRLLQRYHHVDMAAKIVGVGSVGTQAYILLLQGEGGKDDHIFLQFKEASRSVLERFIGSSEFKHPGERIVHGQRSLQASSDLFLGWTTGVLEGRPYYVRQLMDGKASVPIEDLDAIGLENYAKICATVLARGHARTGDPAVIFGYLGTKDVFDEALAKFAVAYAKQNERDYQALLDAINNGKIAATPGI